MVDYSARNAFNVPLGQMFNPISDKIWALCSELERHFSVTLSDHEGPSLLSYPPGGFYEPHVDRADATEAHLPPVARRISVVILVNADYVGGALTFYGLVDDPGWQDYGFALDPEPGLLIAFPSHLRHEVTPVTSGDRFTIVDWFTA